MDNSNYLLRISCFYVATLAKLCTVFTSPVCRSLPAAQQLTQIHPKFTPWGDASPFAAYLLFRSPQSVNAEPMPYQLHSSLARWLALLSVALLLLTCKHNDPLPEPTQSGQNTFGCLINGKSYIPDGGRGFMAVKRGGPARFILHHSSPPAASGILSPFPATRVRVRSPRSGPPPRKASPCCLLSSCSECARTGW